MLFRSPSGEKMRRMCSANSDGAPLSGEIMSRAASASRGVKQLRRHSGRDDHIFVIQGADHSAAINVRVAVHEALGFFDRHISPCERLAFPPDVCIHAAIVAGLRVENMIEFRARVHRTVVDVDGREEIGRAHV